MNSDDSEYLEGIKQRINSPTFKCDYCDKEKSLHEMLTHQFKGEMPYVVGCCIECLDHKIFEHSQLPVEWHILKYIETLIEIRKQNPEECEGILPIVE